MYREGATHDVTPVFGTDRDVLAPRQLYQLGAAPGVSCRLLPPASDTLSCAHYHWVLDVELKRVELPVIPDNAFDLVLCPGLGDFAALYPPVERPFTIALDGPVRYVGSCLRLERLERLCGLDAEALRTLPPGVETVRALALGSLVARLRGTREPSAISGLLDAWLRVRAREPARAGTDANARTLDPSVFVRFLDTLEPERVADIARRAGVSERQLRRETRRLFGLAPKRIQRVARLQRAIDELVEGTPSVADYHDDAHRIRELRALTGWTPGEIRRMAERYNTVSRPASSLPLRKAPSTESGDDRTDGDVSGPRDR